jgi:uncharacterized repeat protein (TIGR01451 family)
MLLSDTITIPPYIQPQITAINGEVCADTGSLEVFVFGGFDTIWYEIIAGPVTKPPQLSNRFDSIPEGTYTVRIVDNCGNSDVQSASAAGLVPPNIDIIANDCWDTIVTLIADTAFLATYEWFDPNGNSLGTGRKLVIDPFDCIDQSGVYSVNVMIAQCADTTSSIFVGDSVPPDVTPAMDTIVECDGLGNVMEYNNWIANNGGATAADDSCGNVSWSSAVLSTNPICLATRIDSVYFIATDVCGNSDSSLARFIIEDNFPPTPPNPLPDVTVQCVFQVPPPVPLTAGDVCSGPLTVNPVDSTADSTCINRINIFRKWTFVDSCDNAVSISQKITVFDNVIPMITCPDDVTLDCPADTSAQLNGFATATDNCGGTPAISYSDQVLPGLCNNTFTVSRTWQAIDDCGNMNSCVQTLLVQDTTKPTIVCPADLTLNCPADTSTQTTGLATGTDECNDPPIITYNDVVTPGDCDNTFSIARTWTAIDSCGNELSCIQSISVQDTTSPVITCPSDLTLDCPGDTSVVMTGMATATDECNDPLVSYSDLVTPGPCMNTFSVTRTWTALDPCGNSSSCVQSILVQDTTSPVITCPMDVTLEFPADTSVANTGTAIAIDECNDPPALTYRDSVKTGDCPSVFTVFRIWTATDLCNNQSSCISAIFVTDGMAPVITCPDDVTLNCPADTTTQNTGVATATDASGPLQTITYVDNVSPGDCPGTYLVARIWTAVDSCGNNSSCTQNILVQDTTPPIISCPSDLTLDCPADTSTQVTGFAETTDECSGPVITYSDVITPGLCTNTFSVARTWTSTDLCGNSNSCVQTLLVQDTTKPTIDCPADITLNCPADTSVQLTGIASGTDECNNPPIITYSDAVTAGNCDNTFSIARTWTATDSCGNQLSCVQSIIVQDTTPPIISCPADLTLDCPGDTSAVIAGFAEATDECNGPQVTYADVVNPGPCDNTFTVSRTWTAVDPCGNSSSCIQSILVQDTIAPIISCPADVTLEFPADTSVANTGSAIATDECNDPPALTYRDSILAGDCPSVFTVFRIWTATDLCDNESTCISAIFVTDGMAPVITCPDDITLNCPADTTTQNTGVATATDASGPVQTITYVDNVSPGDCPGTYSVARVWTAVDSCGNNSSCTQNILVQDTTPPIISCPSDLTLDCPADTSAQVTGFAETTDECSGPVITYSDVVTPGLCANTFSVARTWTSTDVCGNINTCIQTLVVQDTTKPMIVCPADITLDCPADTTTQVTGVATGSDECNNPVVISYSDVVTPGLCSNTFSVARTWTATDACGNEMSCIQAILVQDTTLPAITCPDDITINCPADTSLVSTGMATATDECNDPPDISYMDVVTAGDCANTYSVARTWTATDACGNSSTCVQNIIVQDTTLPVITCPDDITLNCPADTSTVTTGIATATDECNSTPAITYVDAVSPGDCENTFSVVRTWTATDACGNSSSCEQNILVQDTTLPIITCPADITLDCPADTSTAGAGMATATDECNAAVTMSYSDVVTPGSCPSEYSIVRTWSATDACGNTATCDQFIQVQDTTSPVITCPDVQNAECDGSSFITYNTYASFLAAGGFATDECCLDTTTFGFFDEMLPGVNPIIVNRHYFIEDCCGNTDTCIQQLIIKDVTPPTAICVDSIFISADSITGEGIVTVAMVDNGSFDNCLLSDVSIDQGVFTCVPGEPIVVGQVTLTVTDAAGLTASCSAVVVLACPNQLDLALIKTPPAQAPGVGDTVTYTITIFNQGTLTPDNIEITDYIPDGFTLIDPAWTAGTAGSTGNSASIVLSSSNGLLPITGLLPGTTASVNISLMASTSLLAGVYIDYAEISAATDLEGDDISDEDMDSPYDTDDTNDAGGLAESAADDYIFGNGTGAPGSGTAATDEDAHDPALICLVPNPVILGDAYVCPGETVTYSLEVYNPVNIYTWTLNGDGQIIENNGSSIVVKWSDIPGGPHEILVEEETGYQSCRGDGFKLVWIQEDLPLVCNNHLHLSLDQDCEMLITADIALEAPAYPDEAYEIVVTDENGNIIPGGIVTGEHVGQIITISVSSECYENSCWLTALVEDKLIPDLVCNTYEVDCYDDITAGPTSSASLTNSYDLAPAADFSVGVPAAVEIPVSINGTFSTVTDVNVSVDASHTWIGDVSLTLSSPSGTTITLVNRPGTLVGGGFGCANDDMIVSLDDDHAASYAALDLMCNATPPAVEGEFKPFESLSIFNGEDANGTWILTFSDAVGGDDGVVNAVSLELSTNVMNGIPLPIPDTAIATPPYGDGPFVVSGFDPCGDVTLSFEDDLINIDCTIPGELYTGLLLRYWTAVDGYGNTTTCMDSIYLRKASLSDLTLPPDRDDVDAPALSCNGSWDLNNDGIPSPHELGDDINAICDLWASYEDEVFHDVCKIKILRNWVIVDACTGELLEYKQLIIIKNDEAPIVYCIDEIELSTDANSCSVDLNVPVLSVDFGCTDIQNTCDYYTVTASAGTVVHYGGCSWKVLDLPVGTNTITYHVNDGCGNETTCETTVLVVDLIPPIPICDVNTRVSLGSDGTALIEASTFNDGSYDNCGIDKIKVRRKFFGDCEPGLSLNDRQWKDAEEFCCEDINDNPILVELGVWDASGNFNSCWVSVEVEDKLPPYIEAPDDITISCDFKFDLNDLSLFGDIAYRPNEREDILIDDPEYVEDCLGIPYTGARIVGLDGYATDNCGLEIFENENIDMVCGRSKIVNGVYRPAITRVFTAEDAGGRTASDVQRIYIIDCDPFEILDTDSKCRDKGLYYTNSDDVEWPCDVELNGCSFANLSPDYTGRPYYTDDKCSIVADTFYDEVFTVVPDACFKILRHWSILDWCQYDPVTGYGRWDYTQIIKVNDNTAPVVIASQPDCVDSIADQACTAFADLSLVVEDCTPVDQMIVWWRIDLYDDGSGPLAGGYDLEGTNTNPTDFYPYGLHRILWVVEDMCGNKTTEEFTFEVEDCKKPSPVCINGLSSVVMPSTGEICVWAIDFDASSFDNCDSDLEYRIWYPGMDSSWYPDQTRDWARPSANASGGLVKSILPSQACFTCEGLGNGQSGTFEVEIYVIDDYGNWDYCSTYIVIDDNDDVCLDTGVPIIAGNVENELGEVVDETMIRVQGGPGGQITKERMNEDDGTFQFSASSGDNWEVRANRTDSYLNGVTAQDLSLIQRHIAGIEYLNTSYKLVAADANSDINVDIRDVLELRKLLLGVQEILPLSPSWRMLDADYGFNGITNRNLPADVYNHEIISYIDLQQDQLETDFIAVKIGDVDNDAIPNNLASGQGRDDGSLKFSTTDVSYAIGEELHVPITAENFNAMTAYQFSLRYDNSALEFTGIKAGMLDVNMDHVGTQYANRGILTSVWYSANAVDMSSDEVLFTLSFKTKSNGQISTSLSITSVITEAMAFSNESGRTDVELTFTTETGESIGDAFALFQNTPNPFQSLTTIGFVLPEAAKSTLTVYDQFGKLITRRDIDGVKGYNEISLTNAQITASGVLYYQLETDGNLATKKMISVK